MPVAAGVVAGFMAFAARGGGPRWRSTAVKSVGFNHVGNVYIYFVPGIYKDIPDYMLCCGII